MKEREREYLSIFLGNIYSFEVIKVLLFNYVRKLFERIIF